MPFSYEKMKNGDWKYITTSRYDHIYTVRNQPHLGKTLPTVVSIYECKKETCVLQESYAWNGSNVVADTEDSQRASAVHDAMCQAMEIDIYEGSWKNWQRAAAEYRVMCIEDGLKRVESDGKRWVRIRSGWVRSRAWIRYDGILVGGGHTYKWRKWAKKFS
ncbi:MAG: hypothetical protein O7F71_07920 [Gammaproteobacteria bacterium]|nr:hypothetical protein [Gammaproteobacteria bacterium]